MKKEITIQMVNSSGTGNPIKFESVKSLYEACKIVGAEFSYAYLCRRVRYVERGFYSALEITVNTEHNFIIRICGKDFLK